MRAYTPASCRPTHPASSRRPSRTGRLRPHRFSPVRRRSRARSAGNPRSGSKRRTRRRRRPLQFPTREGPPSLPAVVLSRPTERNEGHRGAVSEVGPEGSATAPPAKVRRRARRVNRVIRRIELWSVLKLALVLFMCLYVVELATLAALWGFAYSTGLIDNFESFLGDVGSRTASSTATRCSGRAPRSARCWCVAATLITVLAAALLNVISELTGGIRLVVIEEDAAAPAAAANR